MDSIEIDDPATGQSTLTGHMSVARLAAAVSLVDGRILEAGGVPNDAMTTAELIDPVTGQASPAAALGGPRGLAASILLPDHRVLILSGLDASGRYLNTAEVFVP